MENVKSEIEAFVQRTNELIKSQEGVPGANVETIKESLRQHKEEAASQIPSDRILSPGAVANLAQKMTPTSDDAKKNDEQAKKEFKDFVEEVGIYNAAMVLEKADPHNMDLLHDYLLNLVNQN